MATVAEGWTGTRASFFKWLRGVGDRIQESRDARLDQKLFPAEARFFDAYCRGGAHQRDVLAIDYDFFMRARVRRQLRIAAGGGSLDFEELEAEFTDAEPGGDVESFRENIIYLADCIGRSART